MFNKKEEDKKKKKIANDKKPECDGINADPKLIGDNL